MQAWVSVAGPSFSQVRPLCCGSGLVHVRDLVWVPLPQFLLQAPNMLHSVKPPLTAAQKSNVLVKLTLNDAMRYEIQN